MINSGAINNCPVTINDVNRAERIYGPDVAILKGKSITKTPQIVSVDQNIEIKDRPIQSFHCDIMFIDGQPFLISKVIPLEYSMITPIKSKEKENIRSAMFKQLSEVKAADYIVKTILSDGESAIAALST
jgi:hypothetical protein